MTQVCLVPLNTRAAGCIFGAGEACRAMLLFCYDAHWRQILERTMLSSVVYILCKIIEHGPASAEQDPLLVSRIHNRPWSSKAGKTRCSWTPKNTIVFGDLALAQLIGHLRCRRCLGKEINRIRACISISLECVAFGLTRSKKYSKGKNVMQNCVLGRCVVPTCPINPTTPHLCQWIRRCPLANVQCQLSSAPPSLDVCLF